MKKLISFSLILVLILACLTPASGYSNVLTQDMLGASPVNLNTLTKTQNFDHLFAPATSKWLNIVGGTAPAQFKNVTYELEDNVVSVGGPVTGNIRSAGQVIAGLTNTTRSPNRIISEGGYINKSVLQQAAGTANIQPGTVFYDQSAKTAFKVVTPMDSGETTKSFENEYSVTKPQIHEIIKDFNLPDQTVKLTKANITGFADPQIEAAIVAPGPAPISFSGIANAKDLVYTPGKYTITQTAGNFLEFKHMPDPLIQFMFPKDTTLKGSLGDGVEITVKLNGGLGIGGVELEGEYSGFDGYKIALKCTQESFLQVDVGININKEIRIPLYGFNVDFSCGSVSGGLFLVVSIDGTITIELQARAWATSSVGIAGGTFMYVPTYVAPYFDLPDKGVQGDIQISGQVNGTIKAGGLVSLTICGLELVGVGVFVGAGVTIGTDGKMLNIRLYGLVEVYITFIGEQFNLINLQIDVFTRKQKDMGHYRVKILEACVYQDRVGGVIEYESGGSGRLPEKDVQFRVKVTQAADNQVVIYQPSGGGYYKTDQHGEFVVNGVALSANDQVELLVVDKNTQQVLESGPATPTYPFRSITVNDADYFNDYVTGLVRPAKVRSWGVYDADGEPAYETLYYSGPVTIQIMRDNHGSKITEQTVTTMTDQFGAFKAIDEDTGTSAPMDVKPYSEFGLTLKKDGFIVNDHSFTQPKVQFQLKRVVSVVDGSQKKFNEGAKLIDQSTLLERYYIINMRGSRQLDGNAVKLKMLGFSTQDVWSRHFLYWEPYGTQGDVKIAYMMSKKYWLPEMYPATANIKVTADKDTKGQANGTSYIDNKVIREWVWQPHSNPTVITSANTYTCPAGASAFTVTANGVQPIAFSAGNAPSGVTIDSSTGALTVSASVQPGQYKFNITATAASTQYPPDMVFLLGEYPDYRQDDYPPVSQEFTLNVTAPVATSEATPTAEATASVTPSQTSASTPSPTPDADQPPVITSAASTTVPATGGTFQVTVTGKEPITYSLSSASFSAGVPSQITIAPSTGLITVVRGLPPGTYQFYVNASNGIDPNARQLFTLTVSTMVYSLGRIVSVVRPAFLAKMIELIAMPTFKASTQNTIKIRNDDPNDLYTNDSLWVSGSEYIKWDAILELTIEGKTTEIEYFDNSPATDHHLFKLSAEERAAVQKAQQEMLKETWQTDKGFDTSDGIHINPIDQGSGFGSAGVFDYGSVIDGINKGGKFNVPLGGGVGGVVPGDVFTALKKKAGSQLTFVQTGAKVSFGGSNVGKVTNNDLFDFTFSGKAPNAEKMLGAVSGAPAFTYSFAHNGKLPGFGTFEIATDLPAGSAVNVYKFDAGTGKFAQVAAGLLVGEAGQVTYKNNTTSEYIITTATIAGASRTDALGRQGDSAGIFSTWWFWVAVDIALGTVAGLLLWTLVLKKRFRRSKAQEVEASPDEDETPLPQN